ncbi:MAG: 2-amino-4-hydroxy-6-hydroxymethyldihydropteridine diphosphokinase [Phycisphaerales bacterium]
MTVSTQRPDTPASVFIALGSNLGDRAEHLRIALERLHSPPHREVVATSDFYETDPVGGPADQPTFLNAVAHIRTIESPRELMNEMLRIESDRGRIRAERWGPRSLDLDLLVFADRIIDEPGLRAPHPRLAHRRFVLEPWAQIAPDLMVVGFDASVTELLRRLDGDPQSSGA